MHAEPRFFQNYSYSRVLLGNTWWINHENRHDLYIEGRHGYITGDGETFWVTITTKNRMLATPDFSDMFEEQTLRCPLATLKPLLEIIEPYNDHDKRVKRALKTLKNGLAAA